VKSLGSGVESGVGRIVTEADVGDVVSFASGIPVNSITDGSATSITRIESVLGMRVLGQPGAIISASRAIRRTRSGLKRSDRPYASFIFSGPTGVGKTELAKSISECFYGGTDHMISIDMSEYMEKHSISRLIGSPPGYVGYGDSGVLTERVITRPFSLVLLDEVEKAHPDIFNILLQVLEEGKLTESTGREVSLSNTIVVLTTNIGSKVINKIDKSIKTFRRGTNDEGGSVLEKKKVSQEISKFFRPELLNRLDDIILFKSLSKRTVLSIATYLIASFIEVANSKGIRVIVAKGFLNRLLLSGYKRDYGARPLRRAVEKIMVDHLSEKMLSGDLRTGDCISFASDASGRVILHRLG
jgi:ATP-dependent Clp protease ATP-binding subunit ClpC